MVNFPCCESDLNMQGYFRPVIVTDVGSCWSPGEFMEVCRSTCCTGHGGPISIIAQTWVPDTVWCNFPSVCELGQNQSENGAVTKALWSFSACNPNSSSARPDLLNSVIRTLEWLCSRKTMSCQHFLPISCLDVWDWVFVFKNTVMIKSSKSLCLHRTVN